MARTPETDFFEAVYAGADGDDAAIPWQHAASRPLVEEWLTTLDREQLEGRRAVVVAAGLGDDAAALAAAGMEVVAFDAAPSAVGWARQRHPEAAVAWHVADLFALPGDWIHGFALVLEVFTVQSIPPADQDAAVDAIAELVAPGGRLVAIAIEREPDAEITGPPWPLHPRTLTRPEQIGFERLDERSDQLGDGVRIVRRVLRRAG